MREQFFPASPEAVAQATDFVEDALVRSGCPRAIIIKINIVLDELFSNIARYASATSVRLSCGVEDGFAVLRLCDDGAPFDPLAEREPDITQPAEARKIGGLGVHLVKRLMDTLSYAREDGWNVVVARKRVEE